MTLFRMLLFVSRFLVSMEMKLDLIAKLELIQLKAMQKALTLDLVQAPVDTCHGGPFHRYHIFGGSCHRNERFRHFTWLLMAEIANRFAFQVVADSISNAKHVRLSDLRNFNCVSYDAS